jgi:serine/threonine protein kinase
VLHSAKHILFTVDYAISWAQQTADAVAYLHAFRILHRDLKPTKYVYFHTINIFLHISSLLLHDHYRLLKIGDFGTATDLRTTMTHTCGTLAYMAPETRSTKYDEKCDVYSFGICLHEIFSRKKPFEDMSDCKVIYQVAAMDKRPDPIDGLPPRIVLLMNRCGNETCP